MPQPKPQRRSAILHLLLLLLSAALLHSLLPTSAIAAFGAAPPRTSLQLNNLFLLKPTSRSFIPRFKPSVLSYYVTSPTLLSSLTLQPSANPSLTLQLRLNDGPFFSISSTEAEDVDLLQGINHLFLQVEREDEHSRATVTYLITVCNAVDCHIQPDVSTPTAQLRSLHIPALNLTPPFSPATFDYRATTTRHTHGAIVVPSMLHPASDALIVASMNGDTFTALTDRHRSPSMPMKLGINVLFVQVRDIQWQLCTYSITIDRSDGDRRIRDPQERADDIEYIGGFAYVQVKEASAELDSLVATVGQLTPRFSSAVRHYSIAVDYHVPSIQVSAKPRDKEGKMALLYTASLSSSPAPAAVEFTQDGPSEPIPLCVGVTTIKLAVQSYDSSVSDSYTIVVTRASEADENDGTPTAELYPSEHSTRRRTVPHRPKAAPVKHADPTLLGLRGQSYDVHVEPGQVYNLISEPHLLVNARFVNMAVLNADGSAAQDSEPIIGIGEIGVVTRTGHQLHLETGTGEPGVVGFSRVALNDQLMRVEDQATIDNSEESLHELSDDEVSANTTDSTDSDYPANPHTELLAYNASHVFTLITPNWRIVLIDTREGIEPRAKITAPIELGAHGLLGQTWRDKREGRLHSHGEDRPMGRGGIGLSTEGAEDSMEVLEGSMEDYRIKDGALFSSKFEFNRFDPEGQ